MNQIFQAPDDWQTRRIRILLLGAGGTGGEVSYALARIHMLLVNLGHPGGLRVTLMDGDHVAAPNIGRQRFFPCDLSHNKACVLIHRLNLGFGLDWRACQYHWAPPAPNAHPKTPMALADYDLVVSCVDRASVRVALAHTGQTLSSAILWMDFGNGRYTGQCILGHLGGAPLPSDSLRLPNVFDLYPELETVDDDAAPSCSSRQAIRQQDLFTNPLLAEAGVSLLWRLLHTGELDVHGVRVDAHGPSVSGILIDPDLWAFYTGTPPAPTQHLRPRRRRRQRPRRPEAPARRQA